MLQPVRVPLVSAVSLCRAREMPRRRTMLEAPPSAIFCRISLGDVTCCGASTEAAISARRVVVGAAESNREGQTERDYAG